VRIVAFVGMPASGKSEAAKTANKRNIPVIVMGDVVRREAERRGLDPSDANIGGLADQLRAAEGMDAIAKRCIPLIRELHKDAVVIDGIRGPAEVDLFRREFGDDFMLISIVASIDIRLERIISRKRSDAVTSIKSLKIRDERELGWGMGDAIASADRVIRNTGTLDQFLEEVEFMIDQIRQDTRKK